MFKLLPRIRNRIGFSRFSVLLRGSWIDAASNDIWYRNACHTRKHVFSLRCGVSCGSDSWCVTAISSGIIRTGKRIDLLVKKRFSVNRSMRMYYLKCFARDMWIHMGGPHAARFVCLIADGALKGPFISGERRELFEFIVFDCKHLV